ncbi:HU family DNA-binding protein [Thauera phenolivorans]|nr:HU family DNA-binding protein [Thauera phenolivorans]
MAGAHESPEIAGLPARRPLAGVLESRRSSRLSSKHTKSRKSMNKGEFVEALADRLDLSRAQADRALSAVLDIISEQLAEGGKVSFTGFGSFEVSERAARTGRNPQTGAAIEIAASNVPKFTAGATLKASVNAK